MEKQSECVQEGCRVVGGSSCFLIEVGTEDLSSKIIFGQRPEVTEGACLGDLWGRMFQAQGGSVRVGGAGWLEWRKQVIQCGGPLAFPLGKMGSHWRL